MGKLKKFIQNPGNLAFIYCRYSSDAQRDASIDEQLQAAYDYAKDHGLCTDKKYEFIDRAKTGTNKNRKGLNRMLIEAEDKRPAYLLVWKTDRLSRNRYDSVNIKATLRKHGVKIIYIAEPMPEDDESSSLVIESVREAVAEMFILDHTKNVMRGMNYNAERCYYNGVVVLGYKGVVDCPYIIDPNTAPIVKQIFESYVSNVPLKKICDSLNKQGLKSTKGNAFTINSLRRILTNKNYIGVYKWGAFSVPDGMPKIIDEELFNRAQAKLKANQRGGKGAIKCINTDSGIEDFWLSGHVFCGLCNDSIQGISGTGKTGKRFHYYSCKNHRKHKCSMKNIKKDLIESTVMSVLDEIVHDPINRLIIANECYEYLKKRFEDKDDHEEAIRSQIREIDIKIKNIMKAIEAGIFTESTKDRLTDLEDNKKKLNEALIIEQNRQKIKIESKDILKWLDKFDGDISDPNKRRMIMEYFIDRILLFEDKLVIIFKYTDKREIYYADACSMDENVKFILEELNRHDNYSFNKVLLDSLVGVSENSDFF